MTPIWLHLFKVRIEEGFAIQVLLLFILSLALSKVFSHYRKLFIGLCLGLTLVSLGRLSAGLVRRFIFNKGIGDITIPSYLPKTVKQKPDLYFLVYDAYMDEKFAKHLGIDNSRQWDFLKTNGFTVFKDKLSLERSSLYSMSLLYNLGKGVESKKTRFVLSGLNPVDKFAKEQGYETFYMAKDYFFRGVTDSAKGHILIPQKPRNTLLDGILQGSLNLKRSLKALTTMYG